MRYQLSVYSDTLPPNAAYVNVTSVNMLLLTLPTQSPSAAGDERVLEIATVLLSRGVCVI